MSRIIKLPEKLKEIWKRVFQTLRSPAKMYRFLGSRGFSIFTMSILSALFAVWLLPFQLYGVPSQVVQNIASKEWLFRIPYLLFFINALICLIQSLPVNIRKISWTGKAVIEPELLKKYPYYYTIENCDISKLSPKIRCFLRLKGYFRVKNSGSVISAHRGKFSPIGNILLHASFFFIPLGILISAYTLFDGYAVVTEGQSFYSKDLSSYARIAPQGVKNKPGRIPDISFRLDNIKPVFWQDKLLFTDLSADVAYPAKEASSYKTIRLNAPMIYKGTFLAIRGFGYSPYFRLKNKEGKVMGESFVTLRVFPPGAEDSFSLQDFPYRIEVSVFPDYIKKKGKIESKSLNLNNPIYLIKLVKDKKVVHRQYLLPGNILEHEGFTLMFPEIRYYGEFAVVKDTGVWVIFGGLLAASLGLVIKFVFYRKEFYLVVADDTIHIAGKSEYFRNLYRREFDSLVRYIRQKVTK